MKSVLCKTATVYIGQKFTRLTVIGAEFRLRQIKEGKFRDARRCVVCRCDCGKVRVVTVYELTCKKALSCGCLRDEKTILRNKEKTLHGQSNTRLYSIWRQIIFRCYDESSNRFYAYGQRGIRVCDEWKNDFMSFKKWADANEYQETLTIDRIDNNKNYEPDNCRFATKQQQAENKRTTVYATAWGETKRILDWVKDDRCHAPSQLIRQRLRLQWSHDEAISTPSRSKKKKA